jgi:cysteine desulfurase
MNQPIYLDFAAATPLDERVLVAMEPFWREQFYNPSSPYLAAKKVRTALEDSRARVAHWVGARPSEIYFTAGATESINIAIHGVMQRFAGTNLLVAATEHEAVLASAANYPHQKLPVSLDGTLDLAALQAAVDNQTVLISVAYANNEVGTIQPLTAIARVIETIRTQRQREGNTLPLYLHTDASQAANWLDLHAARLGVDLLTINGAKLYGPKQTGVLYAKAGVPLQSFITGGGQESGVRSGTENVPGIVGLAAALDIAQQTRKETAIKLATLRDELQRRLVVAFPQIVVNGNLKKRLPNHMHVSWRGVDGERLVMLLDERGVQAATGSACAANKQTASHVLRAIGLEDSLLQGSLRISLGVSTSVDEITQAAEIIIKSVQDCQKAA